jgi:hypothetical protein
MQAKVMALFQRGEIDKAEVNRFLHFENKRRGDKDPRDVGLDHAHFDRVMRVR